MGDVTRFEMFRSEDLGPRQSAEPPQSQSMALFDRISGLQEEISLVLYCLF